MNRSTWLHQIVKPTLGEVQHAVEVGVWRGDYSAEIIAALAPTQFTGVDPYLLHPAYADCPDPVEFANQDNLDDLYDRTSARFHPWSNAILRRQTGVAASQAFTDLSLDFVYIDGDHSYEFVSTDIKAWWPRVKSGGILAGHDYTPGNPEKDHTYGVIQAVTEFAQTHTLQIHTTSEQYATWWVMKP